MEKRFAGGILILLLVILLLGRSNGYAFELNGFADVSFTKSTEGADEFRKGDFAFGTLDLYLAQTLDDIDILLELGVEEGDEMDVERLTIGYTFSDTLRVRVGRFHTPLGFWNNAYHHGVQLQPTIERPDFLKFEDDGGILPVHVIGGYLSGRVSNAAGVVEYGAMLGNGPRITDKGEGDILDPNNISDNNNGKAIAFNVAFAPSLINGFKLGISGHTSEITDDAATVEVDQTIFGAAITYSVVNVDIAGEYFSIQDKDAIADEDYNNGAYYGLITYTYKERWIPYLMYENMSIKEADPYFNSLGTVDTSELTTGLRYNINYRSCLKGEYRRIIDEGDADWNEYALQWALAF